MRKPQAKDLFRIVSAALALFTVVAAVLYLFERHSEKAAVKANLAQRRDALEERIRILIEADARRLLSIDPNVEGVLKGTGIGLFVSESPMWEVRVGDQNLYTGVVQAGEPAISVGIAVPGQEEVFLFHKLPLEPILDAMAELFPGPKSKVYLTGVKGDPVLRWPDESHSGPTTEHRKFKLSTEAFDLIANAHNLLLRDPDNPTGQSGEITYKNLDDRDAVGAWGFAESFHGGIVVEQDQRVAFADVRGVQAWHVGAGLLAVSLVLLLGSMLVPRAKFTADLFRLYAFAKRYWPLIALAVLAMGLYAGGNMFRLTLMKTVFDDVLLGKGAGAFEALKWALKWFAVTVLVMAFASWFKEFITEFITQGIVNDIRCTLSAHILTLDMKFFDRQRAGDLMSRMSNDVGQTRRSLSLIFGEFFQEPLMLIGALGAAFVVNWRLTLIIFIGFPLLVFPIYKLGRMVKKYSKRRQVQRSVVTEVMMQTITGVRTVKAFQMEDHENEKLEAASRKLLKQSVRVARTTAFSKTLIDLMNSTGGLLITAIGGYMVIFGIADVSAADLMTLSVILAHMYKPVKNLTKTYNKIQESLAGAERIFEILDLDPEIVDRPDAQTLERPEREIAFEDVTFAYAEDPVLKNIAFRVKVGEVVALVGETGAGKSTVTDLVAQFYDPTVGLVSVDGVDLRDYSVRSIRRSVSTVSQDAFLFNATVRENILFARPRASESDVIEAAKAAGIHAEILKMEDGYDTVVGERGTRLSGGQRQRVTIARAILKDSSILILDEATSALDSQTEAIVQDALTRLMKDRTTFVIAHRLSTISHADRILVLSDGELVEQGAHDDLLGREDGVYHRLHRIQFATVNGE